MKRMFFVVMAFAAAAVFAGGGKDAGGAAGGGGGTPGGGIPGGALETPLPALTPQSASLGDGRLAAVSADGKDSITVAQLKVEVEETLRTTYAAQSGQQPSSEQIARAVQQLGADEKKLVLNSMINNRLAVRAAAQEGITVSDEELNQAIAELRTQISTGIGRQASDTEFAQIIRQRYGLDVPAFREEARKDGILQKYIAAKVTEPTDEDAAAAYKEHPDAFDMGEIRTVSAIFIRFASASASDKAAAKTRIEQLAAEIKSNSANFDTAFMKGSRSGDYRAETADFVNHDIYKQQYGTAFVDVVFRLKKGTEVSPVLEIPSGAFSGYYIIKVIETKDKLALADTVPGYNMSLRDYIKTVLTQQRLQELVAGLREKQPYTIYEDNLDF